MKKIWPFTFYFLYFAAFAALLPFFVLFYQGLGFSGAQIGLLTGVPPLITLIGAPFGTGLADSTRRHKLIMSLGLTVAIIVVLLLPSFTSFAVIFILIALFNIFMSPIGSLSDSATISMLGEQRAMYGRIRLGGTIGWGLFAPIAGALVLKYGLNIAFWVFAGIMFLNLLVSQKFSFGKPEEHASDHGSIRTLLTNRRWVIFLLFSFLGGVGAFSVASYLYPYMSELGADSRQMGIALTIATLSEIPVFFFGDRLVKRFSSYGLFMIALVLIGIRSLIYSVASTTIMVWVVQIFSGMIFPAMWVAGVSYADENAPVGLKSTAQGLFGAVMFGIGSAVSGFVGGILLENLGGRGMFFVFGIVILVGLALVEGIRRILPREEIVQPVP
jgi:MFS transporter, PPP family, 3-phenylpropionic acid transporter